MQVEAIDWLVTQLQVDVDHICRKHRFRMVHQRFSRNNAASK